MAAGVALRVGFDELVHGRHPGHGAAGVVMNGPGVVGELVDMDHQLRVLEMMMVVRVNEIGNLLARPQRLLGRFSRFGCLVRHTEIGRAILVVTIQYRYHFTAVVNVPIFAQFSPWCPG